MKTDLSPIRNEAARVLHTDRQIDVTYIDRWNAIWTAAEMGKKSFKMKYYPHFYNK